MGILRQITQRLFGFTVIDALDLNRNAWYIDGDVVTASASTLNTAGTVAAQSVSYAELGPGVAGPGLLGGNGSKIRINPDTLKIVVAPGTDIGVNVSVSGMASSDSLSVVQVFKPGASGYIADRTSEYTVGVGELVKAAGSNDVGSFLMIVYRDVVT